MEGLMVSSGLMGEWGVYNGTDAKGYVVYGLMHVVGGDIGEIEEEVEVMGNSLASSRGMEVNRELGWRVIYGVVGGELGCRYGLEGYKLDVVRRSGVCGTIYLMDMEDCRRLGDDREVPVNVLLGDRKELKRMWKLR